MAGDVKSSGAQSCLGILAGGGSLPREVADTVAARGGRVHIVAVEGAADGDFGGHSHAFVHWSALGKALASFRNAGVRDVVFLGRMFRPVLSTARPDWTFLTALPEVIRLLRQGGDDALLRALIGIIEKRGFRVVGMRDCAPELLAGPGPLGTVTLTAGYEADIDLGMQVIAALGPFDIGQAVVCRDGAVVAIEGAEGTDRMLQRAAQNSDRAAQAAARKTGVAVKRPKPGQDLRVDLPAIGPETVRGADAAGLGGVAVMAGHVIVAERQETARLADQAGIFVTGVAASAFAPVPETRPPLSDVRLTAMIGGTRLRAGDEADARLGLTVMQTVQKFAICGALVVRGGRVIAIGTGEPVRDVIARVWRKRRRSGVVVLGPRETITATDVAEFAAKNLAAVILSGDRGISAEALANSRCAIVRADLGRGA
jgi:DUF1009 family protein